MTGYSQRGSWFICPKPQPKAVIRLFCFPYAGGGVPVFRGWIDTLPPAIELVILQLPGRGSRIFEKPFLQMEPLVNEIVKALFSELDRPFALFGHSLGALLCFEVARELQQSNHESPIHMFVAGHGAPHLPDPIQAIYQLPDQEFLERVRQLKGAPDEVFENSELMELFLPVLRADFTLNETYCYKPGNLLNCPITAFGGKDDPRVPDHLLIAWKELTIQSFDCQMFPGDHFFIHSSHELLIKSIIQTLQSHGYRLT